MKKRIWSQRTVSRRRLLRAAAGTGAGIGAYALAGCAGTGEETADNEGPSPESTPQYGGDFIMGTSSSPGHLDAQLGVDLVLYVAPLFYGFLHFIDRPNQQMRLEMASHFEQPDALTYIWSLKPGIKFHNTDPTWGREVTAEDVNYSFVRKRDEPTSQGDRRLTQQHADHFEAVDKYTFRLVTKIPHAPTVNVIDVGYPIVAREAVEKWGDLRQHTGGCGAYILDEFVRGERVRGVRNPDFFMPGRPYLDSFQWAVVPDESTLYQAFRTGRHDYCGSSLDPLKIEQLEKTKGVTTTEIPNLQSLSLMMGVDRPPFNDIRVRKALNLAIDRQDLIDKIGFGSGKFNGPLVADMEYWALSQDDLREFYKVDLAEARSLLSAAGHGDGLEVDVPSPAVDRDAMKSAEVIREQVAKIGIQWSIQPQELGVFIGGLYSAAFQALLYEDLPYAEPDLPLSLWHTSGRTGKSVTGYSNPVADEWVEKQRGEVDPEKRREIIREAQRFFLTEHGPQLNLFSTGAWAAHWDRVHGLPEEGGMQSWDILGLDMWKGE